MREGLERFGKDLTDARTGDYRKLYHEGWPEVLAKLVETNDHDWVTDRFKRLVF